MTEFSDSYTIQPALPSQRAEALLLLLCELPSGDRTNQAAALMRAARAGQVSLEHLIVAQRGNQIVGVVWANALNGRLAAIWPPQLRDSRNQSDDMALALIRAAEARVEAAGEVAMWQASLEIEASRNQQRLVAAGYRQIAVLAQLLATPRQDQPIGSSEPLKFVPYQATDFARLCSVIDLTYRDTLDCPELDSLRSTADSVSGYREIGIGADRNWYFVQYESRDIGCLLLAEHESRQFELVYMGLVAECRGRKWGRPLVNQALNLTREQAGATLMTSVDERNLPALAVYEQAGFSTWQRRAVLVKVP